MKTIEISEKAYDVLKNWASVSRTMTESIRLLDGFSSTLDDDSDLLEEVIHNIDELEELMDSLDNCNYACKQAKFEEQEK